MDSKISACNGLKSVITRQGELETFGLSLKSRITDLENNILAETGKTTDKLQIVKTKDIIKINPLILRTGSSSDDVTYFVPLQSDLVAECIFGDKDDMLLKFNVLGTEIIGSAFLTVSHKRKVYYVEAANPDKLKRIDVDTGEVDDVMELDPSQEYSCHPIIYGKVLDDDIPVFACLSNREAYLLTETGVEIIQNDSITDTTGVVYCDKNKQLYIESVAYTNSSYRSITDTAKGVLLESSFQGDAFTIYSAPANDGEYMLPYSEGKIVELPEDSNYLPLTDYKGAYVFCMPNALYIATADGTVQGAYINLYQQGFMDGFDYFSLEHEDATVVEVSEDSITVASNIPIKIHGQVLYNGQMYDAVVKTYKDFVDFVVAKEAELLNNAALESKIHKVLYVEDHERDISEELPTELFGRYRLIGELPEGFETSSTGASLYFDTPPAKILVDNVSYENFSMRFQLQIDSEPLYVIEHLKNCHVDFDYSGNNRPTYTESDLYVSYCDSVEIQHYGTYKGSRSPRVHISNCNCLKLTTWLYEDDDIDIPVTFSELRLHESNLCTVDCGRSTINECSQGVPGSNILVKNNEAEQIPITRY